ncbi:hypothetical protein LCGC14_2520050 [marine sediment metagenome]|uniref:Uncharacterized protein n=1 Tax=marine sediment metagenome TaxID=412755 RepID=A0A0F9AX34_9ZZZZ
MVTYRQVIQRVFHAARDALRVSVANRILYTATIKVPDLATAGALDADDAAGSRFILAGVPKSGIIVSAWLFDLAAQTVQVDLFFSGQEFVGGTNDDAWDVADAELSQLSHITFTNADFRAHVDNSKAQVDNLGIGYEAPLGLLYCQLVARGTPTYAANSLSVRLAIAEDLP